MTSHRNVFKQLLSFLIIQVSFLYLNAQTVIQMVEYKGVYTVLCEVNGMKGRMIFDTGASKISLSNSFCEILLDNGYISESDFVGQGKCITADGRIIDHAEIILHSVKIGDIELNDVPAVVVNNQNAPMLFGQSAIQMLGEVSMKGDKLYIKKMEQIYAQNLILLRNGTLNITVIPITPMVLVGIYLRILSGEKLKEWRNILFLEQKQKLLQFSLMHKWQTKSKTFGMFMIYIQLR